MPFNDNDMRALNREKRMRKHQERLGTATPACVFCEVNDPRCIQLDHILGQEFSDADVPICANHHAIRTDLQKDHPPKDADPSEPLEQAGRLFHGLADFFEIFEPLCREFGTMLCAEAAARSPRRGRNGGNGKRGQ